MSLNISNNYYDNNIALLKKRFTSLAEEIEKASHDPHFLIQESKETYATLSYKNKRVYSSYFPSKEIARELEKLQDNIQLIAIFGFGLGYLATAFASHFLSSKNTTATSNKNWPIILCIEPSFSRLKSALCYIDIAPLLEYPQLLFSTTTDIDTFLETIIYCNTPFIQIFKTAAIYETQQELFSSFIKSIHNYQDNWEVNINTTNAFHISWIKNSFSNIKRLQNISPSKNENKISVRGVKNLFNLFSGATCLLVAAGPTLDEQLPLLQYCKDKALIICVDTALPFLLENGITPDFIVTSDSQYANSRHLDFQDLKDINVITELSIHHMLFLKKIKGLYLYQSFMPIYRIISQFIAPLGELATGGSVATTAWDFANKLGVDRIYCVGLDLCYPMGLTHSRYSKFERTTHQKTLKTTPIENIQYALLCSNQIQMVKNIMGNEIPSDKRMLLYKQWFETTIHKGKAKSYLISSKGLSISGFEIANDICISSKEIECYKKAKSELATKNYPTIEFNNKIQEKCKNYLHLQADILIDKQLHLMGKEPLDNPGAQLLYYICFDELSKTQSDEERAHIIKKNLNRILKLF